MTDTMKRRVGVFLIANRIPFEQRDNCIFPPAGMSAFDSWFGEDMDANLTVAQAAQLQAYKNVSFETNLVISVRDLVSMGVVVDRDGKKPVECHYFYLPEVAPEQLLVEPTKSITFRGRRNFKNFMIMPLDDALIEPMDPITQRMLMLLSERELQHSDTRYGYAERPRWRAEDALPNQPLDFV